MERPTRRRSCRPANGEMERGQETRCSLAATEQPNTGADGEMWEVLKSTKKVSERSRFVRVDQEALVRFAKRLSQESMALPGWDTLHHFFDGSEKTVMYFLVLDSVNFCFWAPSGLRRWETEWDSRKLSGYNGLASTLKQAVELGIPITEADYLAELTQGQLRRVLDGTGELQLMAQRVQILNEVGHLLLREYGGRAAALVEAAEGSALGLVRLLADKLTSFRDTATYLDAEIFFYKRAQVFVADLHGAFAGRAWGRFNDIDQLTAFSDYKLPQVLRRLGILQYKPELAQKVDQEVHLEPSSPEEVEIRANTIWAVELIRRELEQMGKRLRAFEIDWILWNLGQGMEFRVKPYHRTLTIYY